MNWCSCCQPRPVVIHWWCSSGLFERHILSHVGLIRVHTSLDEVTPH